MWPDRVSNPGPLTYESGALPTALRDPAASHDFICYYPSRPFGGDRVRLVYKRCLLWILFSEPLAAYRNER